MKRQILKDFELTEISGVDRPAQPTAKATIIKRHEIEKEHKTEGGETFPASDYAYVPDKNKPSTWKLRLTSTPGGDPDPRIVGAAVAALGAGYRGNKVEIPAADKPAVIGRVRAAWHKANPDKDPAELPDVLRKNTSGMEDDTMSELDDLKTQVADLTKKLEESEAIAKMSDDEKMYMAKMSPEDKAKFMSMSAEERKKKMGMMKRDDESIEVAGQTVSKSVVGDAMFEILKAQDAQLKANQDAIAKAQDAALTATLTKRADDEFGHLVGKSEDIAELLKAAGSMSETAKTTLEAIMKSAEEMASKAFTKRGISNGGDVEKSATEKVDTLAKAYATEKSVDYATAYTHVLNANPDLYTEMQKEGN